MSSTSEPRVSNEAASWFNETFGVLTDHISDAAPHVPRIFAAAIVEALIAGTHVLIHDQSMGAGRDLAVAASSTVQGANSYIRLFPELKATDIVGYGRYVNTEDKWEFHKGPVFADILTVEPLHLGGPSLIAALEEVLNERHVTVDGVRHQLPEAFFCIGIEQGQSAHDVADRLAAKAFGSYLNLASVDMRLFIQSMPQWLRSPKPTAPRITAIAVAEMRQFVRNVYISDGVFDRISTILSTIADSGWFSGGLTREVVRQWCRSAQSHALAEGRPYLLPKDVDVTAPRCLPHRLGRSPRAIGSGLSSWHAFDLATSDLALAAQGEVGHSGSGGRSFRALLHRSILEWVGQQPRETTEDFIAPTPTKIADISITDAVSWLASARLIVGQASPQGHIKHPRLTEEGWGALEDTRTPYDFVSARQGMKMTDSGIHFGDNAVVYGLQMAGSFNTQSVNVLPSSELKQINALVSNIQEAITTLDSDTDQGARALESVKELVDLSQDDNVTKVGLMARAREALVLSAAAGGGQALIQGLSELVRILAG